MAPPARSGTAPARDQCSDSGEAATQGRDRRHVGMIDQDIAETHDSHEQDRCPLDEAEYLTAFAGSSLALAQTLIAPLKSKRSTKRQAAFRLDLAEPGVLFIRHMQTTSCNGTRLRLVPLQFRAPFEKCLRQTATPHRRGGRLAPPRIPSLLVTAVGGPKSNTAPACCAREFLGDLFRFLLLTCQRVAGGECAAVQSEERWRSPRSSVPGH